MNYKFSKKILFVFLPFFTFLLFQTNLVYADSINCEYSETCSQHNIKSGLGPACVTPSEVKPCDCGSQEAACIYSGDLACYDNRDGTLVDQCPGGDKCECTTVNVPGCTNPIADNYNSDATTDDGSCVISQPVGWYNLNFNVRDQNNSPRRDALVTIGQNFGNGTTRYTDGAGFANFGIPQNNNVNYTVSDSGCTTVTGSRLVGNSDQTVNVSMNCTTDDGGGNPPQPGPQPAVGTVESANCTAITGAAGDPDNWGVEIGVYLFSGNTFQAGGTYVADVMTNIYRPDVNANFGITGNHGFSIPYPDALRDNVARNFYVHPRDLGDTGPFTRLYYPSWGVNNVITLQCPPIPTTPVTNNVTISSPMVTPNGSTQYTISHTGSDTGGSAKITYQYALLRDDAGVNKGWFAWNNALDPWSTHKNAMACAGGGYGAILSASSWAGYGDQYVRLISCSTSSSGDTRTTNFVMVFEPTYTTTLTGNDIHGITYNTNNNYSPWTHFDTNFGLNMPALGAATISPSPVTANNTNHTITVVGTDPSGGTNISHEYALVNFTGANAGQHRGYVTWYYDSAYAGWNALKNKMSCTGGGIAAIQTGYGDSYMTLISCTTSTSGNFRTTSFVVRFDPSFTTPTTNNLIDGYIHNMYGHNTGWVPGDLFNLNVLSAPTVTSPTVSGITTTGATLGANVTSLGNPASISARGTCWGTVNPPLTNCSAASGLTTGVYTHARTSMSAGTTYYYRGYATNSTGTGYSPVSSFTTTAAASPTLSASPLTATAGTGNLTATFANIPTPMSLDWIGLYQVGANDDAYVDWVWASDCTRTASTAAAGRANGSCSNLPVPATGGSYEFRMFQNNSFTGWPTKLTSQTIVVSSAVTTYNLSVTATSSLGGSVTSAPAGINCGGTCTAPFNNNSSVTLTAKPKSSLWRFSSWGGDCSGTATTCVVTVNGNKNVIANFVPRSFIYKEF
jgi:hypothetical protein